ncbi:MAG: protealysin inhibitor emfourin [Nocardioidaceae bacterium]
MSKTTLAAAALVAVLAACGSTTSPGTTPSSPPPTGSPTTSPPVTPTATAPREPAPAREVTLMRGGGLRPVRLHRVFALDSLPPAGFTRTEVAAVLKAAGDPALRALRSTTPGETCCDLYVYRVTVTWQDDKSTTFTTVDGAADPPPLHHLLALIS